MMWVVPDRKIHAGDPTLQTIGAINASHYLWTVNLTAGEQLKRG